ncbi:IS1595 family transposase, partial [Proteiniphilum sp. X52]
QAYECKRCRARQTLRSGTVMQHSNLPYRYWFVAMHLLTATKGSFSAAELQRQLGHKRYQPIWEMVNKLRDVMGKRDDEYTLEGAIELDDAFFSTEISLEERDKPLKR